MVCSRDFEDGRTSSTTGVSRVVSGISVTTVGALVSYENHLADGLYLSWSNKKMRRGRHGSSQVPVFHGGEASNENDDVRHEVIVVTATSLLFSMGVLFI